MSDRPFSWEYHPAPVDQSFTDHQRIFAAGFFLLRFHPLFVGFRVVEFERVFRLQLGIPFLEGAFFDEHGDAVLAADLEVVAAFWAYADVGIEFLFENDFVAAGAFEP